MSDPELSIEDLQVRLAHCDAEAERAARIQASLYSVADAASAASDMQDFYASLHRIVAELMYAGNFFIATLDDETNILSWPYHVDEKDTAIWDPRPPEEFHGSTGYVIRSGRSLHVRPDYAAVAARGEVELVGTMPEDGIFVPLKLGSRVLGALAVQSYTAGVGYTDEDVHVLTFVAQHVATALTRARAIDETRRRNNELAILNSVGEAMARTLDVKTVTRLVGDKVRDIFDADAVSIDLLDAQGLMFQSAFQYDKGEGGYVEYIEPYPLGTGLNSTIVRTRQPLRLGTVESQIAAGAHIPREVVEKGKGVITSSWMGVPIVVGDRVLGAVNVSQYEPNVFNEGDVRLLQTLAANMGVAIQNAGLFEAEQQRVIELRIINRIQQGLASKLELQGIIDLVGEQLREILHTDDISIHFYDKQANLVHTPYVVEHGKRLSIAPYAPGAFYEKVQNRFEPVFGSYAALSREYGLHSVPGTDISKSLARVPIVAGSQVIGSIMIEDYEREDAYNESNVRLLQTIASSMGVALENARLFDETQRLLKESEQRAAELAIINSVQEGLASKLDYNAIIQLVGSKVMEIFEADTTYVALFDAAEQLFRFPFYFDRGATLINQQETLKLGPGLTSRIFMSRKPILLGTIAEQREAGGISPAYQAVTEDRNETYLGVPILLGDSVLGVISVQRYQQHAYDERQVSLLQTLANSMSVALENARLFDETQRLLKETEQRSAELAVINSVQSALAAKLDIGGIYDAVGDKIVEIFPRADVGIRVYDPVQNKVLFPYATERGHRIRIEPIPLGGGIFKHVLDTREPLLLNENLEQEMARRGSFVLPGTQLQKSALYVPIVLGQEARGMVELADMDHEQAFAAPDVRLLTTVADAMSVALENARLFDEVQNRNREISEALEQQTATSRILAVMAASPSDIQPVLEAVAQNAAKLCQADDVQIYQVDGSHLRQVAHTGPLPSLRETESLPLVPTLVTGRAVLERRAIQIKDAQALSQTEFPESVELQARLGHRSIIVTPMIREGEAIGAIVVRRNEVREFTERQATLLSTFADQAAIAIENVRLFTETQRLLKETDQRAAELQIINSVQQGLASKLEMQAIYDLVGDRIQEVFDAQTVLIDVFDHEKRTRRLHYQFEDGRQELDTQTVPFNPLVEELIATRQPIVINENSTAEMAHYGLRVVPGTSLPKSLVFVPFGSAQQVNGHFSLQNSHREHAFSESDVRLLQTLAGSLGIALENARLFEAERKRAAELAAISAVSQALVAEPDLARLIQLIGDQLLRIFSPDIAYVALVDDQMKRIDFPYKYGDEFPTLKLGEGLTSKIIESAQPLLINHDIGARAAELGTERVGKLAASFLGVPILAGGRAIGVISVQSTSAEDMFNEDDSRLLTTIAANAGAAIQTARLHAETQHRALEMATLAEIGSDIAASRELEPVLSRIATHVNDIMRTRRVAIVLRDPEGPDFRIRVATGPYEEKMRALPIRPGQGIVGSIIGNAKAEIVNNAGQDPRVVHVPGTPADEDAKECIMGAPLISHGEVIGGMIAWRDQPYGVFAQAELDFLVSVARQTTIGIESARLYLETQRRANEMSALAEVGREISSSLDPTVVLERIAQRAQQLLAAQTGAVFLMEKDHASMRAIAAVGQMAEEIKTDRIALGHGVIGSLAQEAKAEFVNDLTHDPRAVQIPGTEDVAIDRLMAAPLLKGEEVMGMLAVWRSTQPFRDADLNFLVGLARQAAIALENARLFAEIEAQKKFSEALVDNSPVAIMSIDEDSRVIAWNPGAEKLFGYAAAEAVGRNIDDLIANADEIRAEAVAYSQQAGRAEYIHAITKRTRKGGSFVDVEISGVPVTIEGGRAGFIGLYHDITELQRARKEAVAANEAKSAFLATMSHEIRTPMNAVIGMSGLLMDTALSPEQREYAETIRNSGNALLGIINDILDFSKIEAGKMELEHQPFDLRECVESALDLVAARAVEKNLDLAYSIDEDVPTGIRGDVTRLRQILLNLMSNALKFTEKGEVVLSVKPDRTPDHLLFTVRDSGIGIPADRMARLFESFSQADSSTTRRFGGTGLGLAISKRLAELMDGTMWAESPGAGKGSTFSFTIAFEAAAVIGSKTSRDLRGIQPALKGKRVLIVDDNATNRRILAVQTQRWGMVPRDTESPAEALRWLKSDEDFDLAILDVQMPEVDGVTLTRELRQVKGRQRLPVILLTSLGRKEAGAGALNFAAYLTKPLKPSALFDALVDIFAGATIARREPRGTSVDSTMASRHPLKILLAEDNAVNQKLALRLLEQMGYRADLASNGLEAVDSVQRQGYDLVLMDVQMPEMDGLDATRAIRKLDLSRQPRIVAMTANAMQGDREMCLRAGMDDYLSKPIRVQDLAASLEASVPVQEPRAALKPGASGRSPASQKKASRSPAKPIRSTRSSKPHGKTRK